MTLLETFTDALQEFPLIAILRGITPDEIIPVSETLAKSGFRLIEVPMNSPDAIVSIEKAANHFRDHNVLIGAGTVLDVNEVEAVHSAGGTYVISPNTDTEVIAVTKANGMISVPGFLTPTEAFTAGKAGADFLKCFPYRAHGPAYIKDLKAVMTRPLLAVGGVSKQNLEEVLQVANGAGIGSSLYKPGRGISEIRQAADEFQKVVKSTYSREKRK